MSAFWSGWIMFLVVLNFGITLFLFVWGQFVAIPTQPDGTSGHVWAHGVLREGVRRLPLWWVLMSASVFVIGMVYLVLYPGFGSYKGLIGWSAHDQLARESAANQAKLTPVLQSFEGRSVEQLAAMPEATRMGHRLFVDNCAACHGLDGRGNHAVGAPDLTDQDWLWGGSSEAILTSILDGRRGTMPPFQATFSNEDIERLANYVQSLSGPPHSPSRAAEGKAQFTVCSTCHGVEGKGNPALGAPNLTHARRLYGGDLATIEQTIRYGRSGTMPAWRTRLGEGDVRLIAAWIYAKSHGGDAERH
ncbi:cytochrome-c oxidase, cbb3-type subunit III [Dokdonella sp.]|uniref:cytochrome-c oxidase, cbb3-type subunit III n=1 Tax=Dokdonella sp. TaxID=2291710 RepID=UPI001B00F3DA|nr:cytochrome-c oxidase, cbb3-type subunit III [Dokdonella sp.]MBO9663013.1 cytochrome-c oxidase, cbb3-type subunit III [Dokdonella sp.]